MKKTLIALAAVASTAAFAQSTVTISGSLNAGIANSGAGNTTVMTSNQAAANNITFSGTEDLGGGLKASFSINQRFNPANGFNASNGSGAITGVAGTITDPDGNDAYAQNVEIKLAGGFGEIKAGRFTGVVQGPVGGYDPFGTDTNGVGFSVAPQVRNNGQIAYTSPDISGLKVALQYTMKNNNDATTNATPFVADGTELAVTYAAGPLSAMVGYTKHGIATEPKTTLIAGGYDFGVARLTAGYANTDGSVDTKQTMIGVKAPMGALTLKGGWRTTETAGVKTTRWAAGVTYALSKRTSLLADMNKDTNVDAQYYIGARHSF